MAFDAFLKIDGIDGESQDDNFKKHIEVISYNHSIIQPTTQSKSSAGGGTAGRCEHGDFSIVKEIDLASPLIYQRCSEGAHIKEVKLILCRAGGDKLPFMEFKMSNVVISGVAPSGNKESEGLPFEDVTFNYGKIEWTYTQQKREGGKGGGNTTGSWDLQKNKP